MTTIRQNAIEIEQKIQNIANSDPYDVPNHHKQLHTILVNRIGIAKLYCNESDIEKKSYYFQGLMMINEQIKQFLSII
jgi:hypothetical protein